MCKKIKRIGEKDKKGGLKEKDKKIKEIGEKDEKRFKRKKINKI